MLTIYGWLAIGYGLYGLRHKDVRQFVLKYSPHFFVSLFCMLAGYWYGLFVFFVPFLCLAYLMLEYAGRKDLYNSALSADLGDPKKYEAVITRHNAVLAVMLIALPFVLINLVIFSDLKADWKALVFLKKDILRENMWVLKAYREHPIFGDVIRMRFMWLTTAHLYLLVTIYSALLMFVYTLSFLLAFAINPGGFRRPFIDVPPKCFSQTLTRQKTAIFFMLPILIGVAALVPSVILMERRFDFFMFQMLPFLNLVMVFGLISVLIAKVYARPGRASI